MSGIFEGLNYLHEKDIIHRDIKLEDIMLKDPNDLSTIIIVDFGLSNHS